jgi:uncharacterized protein YkwD
MRPALTLTAIAFLAAGCAGEPRTAGPLDPRMVQRLEAVRLDPAEAQRIFNAYRARNGLGPVRLDPALTAMAQRQADAMARQNSLSHGVAGSFASRVHAAGLDAGRSAENLGGGYESVAEAFEGWQRSSGHDANLKLREATRFGIALAKDPRTRYRAWWALVVAGEPEPRREIDAGPLVPARVVR